MAEIKVNGWQEVIDTPIEQLIIKSPEQNGPEALEKILRAAARACAQECVKTNRFGRIYTTLSGGVDSSLCLALLRSETGDKARIHTFTIGLNTNHPDIIYARQVSKLFKTEHHEFVPNAEQISWAIRQKNALTRLFPGEGSRKMDGIEVFLLYWYISSLCQAFSGVIVHDGIDELLGGYWKHRISERREEAFKYYWQNLPANHLLPLSEKSQHFSTQLFFPYLQKAVVKFITAIPLDERTSYKESKMPLRRIARKYLPSEITERPKIGFCDALKTPRKS